jgi:hypothetical protein
MTLDEAIQHLAETDRIFSNFEETKASASGVLSLLDTLERLKPVIGGLQAYIKDGGKSTAALNAVVRSLSQRFHRLQPLAESGSQYCSLRLAMLYGTQQGYTADGTVSPAARYGAIREEA